jgi:hypothetical protein
MVKVTADDGEMQGYKTCDEPFAIFNNDEPWLDITYPTSGQKLEGTVMIEWEAGDHEDGSEGLIADVYYKIGLSTYEMLLTGQPNEGFYEWDTTSNKVDFVDGIYGIKVIVTDSHGAVVEKEVEGLEVYNPDAPNLNIDKPEDEETIKGKYAIKWDCDDPDMDDVSLSFFYSSDLLNWNLIAADRMNDNSGYVWDTNNIPDGLYHLKIEATDGVLVTESIVMNITISNYVNYAPVLEILTPAYDEEISGTFEILWNAVDENEADVLKISIGYSQNLATYTILAEDLENTGSYSWDTLKMEDGEYTLEITVSDGAGEEVSEISYRFFIKNEEDPDDNIDPSTPSSDNKESGSSSTGLIIGIIAAIIVLLAVLAVVIFLFIKNSKSDDGVIDPLKQPLPIGPNSSQMTLQGVNQGALPSFQDDKRLPPPGTGMPPAQP